jgi:hypothetical protein
MFLTLHHKKLRTLCAGFMISLGVLMFHSPPGFAQQLDTPNQSRPPFSSPSDIPKPPDPEPEPYANVPGPEAPPSVQPAPAKPGLPPPPMPQPAEPGLAPPPVPQPAEPPALGGPDSPSTTPSTPAPALSSPKPKPESTALEATSRQ